ncbi:LemA family protein [Paraburkholderia phenoliruptrix]|uniref:LemA family protein n=1 Tax=Paraburkholderia phenoliruptrix TaxID=252970 RepID=UPI001C6F5157|nr:LemA family protein [Paraburkholderia phenoliruptrix]MBW9103898.1 LemA family protein [Paraburkholderia phenoliruptrix]
MRKTIAGTVILLVAIALLGGCLPHYDADDVERKAALGDLLQQYAERTELSRQLIALVQPASRENSGLADAVTAAQANLDCMRTDREALLEQIPFERFEIAQRQLGDAISRLVIEAGNDPHLDHDARFRSLLTQLAAADRRIVTKRKAYDEAVDRYNRSRSGYFHDIEARTLTFRMPPAPGPVVAIPPGNRALTPMRYATLCTYGRTVVT